jgi:3-methylcrotonyl-CoA carboxylase alpha subunit
MFEKVLIANRGEIAVRIARACRALGIKSVAVYSEADRDALHVRACDEAYCIGPAPSAESYLRGDKVIEVAKRANCQAIHPGYGFLSENADFAREVTDAGLVWIGPPPGAIELMGSKIESKRLAKKLGVPTVPGYAGDDQDSARLEQEATSIGYPVLIKASAGGGGKGMRVVEGPADFHEALGGAQREAQAAFGDATVLLEKYLAEPRHIEVQVLGDAHGNLIHLGERECSIQRRHQKVFEEAPSPAVIDAMREKIARWALELARAAGYSSAGTVEFIYQGGEFYFLEMNTRLQVEHPVTEQALGFDIVEAQIRIASGEPLWLTQDQVRFESHAMEARLYAEDPEHGFLPSTGTISDLEFAEGGRVRIDAGVTRGDAISAYYDPMIAKITTWGDTRRSALLRMREALGEMQVIGPKTNLNFLRWLVAHPEFESGNISTRFIDGYYEPGAQTTVALPVLLVAGALHCGILGVPSVKGTGAFRARPWRQANQGVPGALLIDGARYDYRFAHTLGAPDAWQVEITRGDSVVYDGDARLRGQWRPSLGEEDGPGSSVLIGIPAHEREPGAGSLSVDYEREHDSGHLRLSWDGRTYLARPAPALSTESLDNTVHLVDEETLQSPMPGKVLKVYVAEGDEVADDQPLVIIEAMKMEFTVKAPHSGTVARIYFDEGAQVAVGDVLVELK